ncbi:antifreeze protein [Gymnopilus junonius]|uniref:Antifreeze protein n=1 Tax=Gymnopilus junonius TaxID=109634 RepID=A0A9P5NSP7_GYMJU|nr:antifreeze protein [Gymnopilus junonius]
MLFYINLTSLGLVLMAVANSVLALGPAAVNLHTAGNFAILSKAGVSTVPPSSIRNVGVSPIDSTGLTGFALTLDSSGTFSTSTQVTGELFAASYTSPTPSQLTTAVLDMQTAFTDASGRANPNFRNLRGGSIGGLTFPPGLYQWTSGVNVANGISFSGSATDTWIFQIAGTLSFATGVRTTLIGGAQASNIVWVISGAATLGTGSHFEGVVLGKKSITLQTGMSINGRILGQTNVALQSATVVG